jgi:hypothetical protein
LRENAFACNKRGPPFRNVSDSYPRHQIKIGIETAIFGFKLFQTHEKLSQARLPVYSAVWAAAAESRRRTAVRSLRENRIAETLETVESSLGAMGLRLISLG